MSDFNEEGALEVLDKFLKYKKKLISHDYNTGNKNILVSGFGLFSGVEYNVSGALAECFSDYCVMDGEQHLKKGILEEQENGVRVIDRKIQLNGTHYNLRVLILDVLWDFAGAVISHEMQKLNPEAVLMMGRGNNSKFIFEAGALNCSNKHPGFQTNGQPSQVNTPIKKQSFLEQPAVLNMTWDNETVAKVFKRHSISQAYEISTPVTAREENTYICNNLSYVALLTAMNKSFKLANNKLAFTPSLTVKPKVGFLHLPNNLGLKTQNLSDWMKALNSILEAMV